MWLYVGVYLVHVSMLQHVEGRETGAYLHVPWFQAKTFHVKVSVGHRPDSNPSYISCGRRTRVQVQYQHCCPSQLAGFKELFLVEL